MDEVVETALAVLLTVLAFIWADDDADEDEKEHPSINIECKVNDYTDKDK